VPELRAIATAIIGSTTALAWSLDQGILFFDERFYLPAASPLLPNLLRTLLIVGRTTNLRLLAVDFHIPPMTATFTYTFPVSVFMAREWPQGILTVDNGHHLQ
jgi:hypothetical protein